MGGDPELLIYNAMYMEEVGGGITVGNGRQTSRRTRFPTDAVESLKDLHREWGWEEDPPIYTPRISGIFGRGDAAFGIIKKTEGGVKRLYHSVPLRRGEGRFLSTYNGPDIPIPPYFEGQPRIFNLDQGSAEESARSFYELFAEKYRVSVVALHASEDFSERDVKIINLND